MKEYRAFEILGPIMVGPSSSHTAGACKIARVAARICPENYKKVIFYLHGSFAMTYKGHGTDRALLGGILGFKTYDDRIRDAFKIEKKKKINYEFVATDLGEDFHPNTVKISFVYEDHEEYVIGSSIGGGNMIIVDINGIQVEFDGTHPTLLFRYNEQKGIISEISSILYKNDYNIESINTIKDDLTEIVNLTIELDQNLSIDLVKKLTTNSKFLMAKYVEV